MIGGQLVRVHVFACKLGYSRRIFAKAYYREDQDTWLDGIESAFRFFDGVPNEIVCDNAKSLVKNRYAPRSERFTERFEWLCNYYGVEPIATAVRKPRSKGKVESAVKYVKRNALVNVNFNNLEELNLYLEKWTVEVSDTHKISDCLLEGAKTPGERWIVEKPALRPLNKAPIAVLYRLSRKVTKNGLVRLDNEMYRVPNEFAMLNAEILVGRTEITVTCAGKTITLNKAEAIFTPEQQTKSNSKPQEEKYKDKIKELEENEEWQKMQKPQVQRPTSAYDSIFESREDHE